MADPIDFAYAIPPYAMMNGENPFYSSNWPPPNSNFYWPGWSNSRASSGLGAGTIILVAVLVTGFSLMALLILRLWFCGCGQDEDARGRMIGPSAPVGAEGNVHKYTFGLRREQIESFLLVNYGSLVAARGPDGEESGLGCPVCLVDFLDEDKRIRVLPGCGHSFHSECIDMWLFSHTSCPVCRRDLRVGSNSCTDNNVSTSESNNNISVVDNRHSSDRQDQVVIQIPHQEQQR